MDDIEVASKRNHICFDAFSKQFKVNFTDSKSRQVRAGDLFQACARNACVDVGQVRPG